MPNHQPLRPIVLFDVVGTLIYPDPSVSATYQSIAARHGTNLSQEEISRRFPLAYRKHFVGDNQGYQRVTSESLERDKWKRLVASIFDNDFSNSLFEDLWQHFSLPENWGCFPEAKSRIDELLEVGIKVGVASNFDSRLVPVIQDKFPAIPVERIFYSTQLGYAKPDVRFYSQINERLMHQYGKIQTLMIGDHWQLDVETPRRAGWASIWKSSEQLPSASEIKNHFTRNYFFRKT